MNVHAHTDRLAIHTDWYRVRQRHERVARAARTLRRIGATLPSRYTLHALVLSLAVVVTLSTVVA
jgi:hypothetical protein